VSVVEESPPGVPASTPDVRRRYAEAQHALTAGHTVCPHAWTHIRLGSPSEVLTARAREIEATLIAVGAPSTGRLGALVLGDTGTYVLQNAPCSVLIARGGPDASAFPRSIVVGHDGSRTAERVTQVATGLAARFGASLRVLAATGGGGVDASRLPEVGVEWSDLPPVEALVAASQEADLVVIGSSGLHGSRPLGSVSERVGHLAGSSVLVVRPPAHARGDVADDDAAPGR
jgi:nucleotide-binding universal stress UspA family protein